MLHRLKEIGWHSLVYGSGIFISRAMGFLLIPLYTNYLSREQYGTVALLDFTVTLIGFIGGMNISQAIGKFYFDEETEKKKKGVISTALIIVIIAVFFVCQIVICSSEIVSTIVFKSSQYSIFYKFIFGTLFFELILDIPLQYLRILNKSIPFAIMNISKTILSLSLNILFIAHYRLGVLGILYANLIVNCIFCLVLLLWLRKVIEFEYHSTIGQGMIRFSLPLIPAGIAATCLHSADTYILNFLSGPSQVGLYALGYKFGNILSSFVQAPFALVWGPMSFRILREKGGKELVAKVMSYYSFVSIGVGLCISIYVKDIFKLMVAPEYYNAIKVTPIIVLGYIFFGIAGIFHLGILYDKKTEYSMMITIVAACSNICLNFIFIPFCDDDYKYMGAAFATVISFIILAWGRLYYSNKFHRIEYEYKPFLKALFIAIILYMFSEVFIFQSILQSLLVKTALLFLYPFALFGFGCFDRFEIEYMKNVVYAKLKYNNRS